MLQENIHNEDKDLLKAWYQDSLSLMKNGEQSLPLELANVPTKNWKNCLGVLNLTNKGEELWSYGDTRACHAFLAETEILNHEHDTVKVEIFDDGLIMLSGRKNSIRIVHIDHQSTLTLLQDVVPDIELSKAELRLLIQILSGQSLRDAAQSDGVSYETKRSQFKSLASRTGFRTQSEVIRMSLMALNAQVLDSVENAHEQTVETAHGAQEFVDLYYPKTFRFHRISITTDRTLRVIETGPLTGKPVVYVHSQTLPPPDQFSSDWLEENNIRLIIPLREGFLHSHQNQREISEHLKRGASDLADTIIMFCGGKARVIACSCGAAYAVHLAKNQPELFESLTVSTAPYLGNYNSTPIKSIVRGFKNLALKSNLILEKTYSRYVSKMSTPAGMIEVLSTAYKNSPSDMKLFNAIVSDPLGHSWMYESYRLSQQSVTNDILLGSLDVWNGSDKIELPILFIHGATDPINAIEDARHVQQKFANSEFIELLNEGQSFFRNRFKEIISLNLQDWKDLTARD
ncbi:MAG: alpha/beta hydrolase [Rhizobiaceae bacterium]